VEQTFHLVSKKKERKTLTFNHQHFSPQHFGYILNQAEKMGLKITELSTGKDLQMTVEGQAIKHFMDKICKKLLNFDKFLSPSKKELISRGSEI
jgi:hypothetical protein